MSTLEQLVLDKKKILLHPFSVVVGIVRNIFNKKLFLIAMSLFGFYFLLLNKDK